MNEELQKQLAALLAQLMTAANDAAKFAGDQIPPLIQEKIAFGRAWETITLAMVIVGLAVGGYWLKRFWKFARDTPDDDWVSGAMFSTLGFLIAVGVCIDRMHQTLLVWFAPRLYIVEWLKGMVSR